MKNLKNFMITAQVILLIGIVLTAIQKLQLGDYEWLEVMKHHVYWGTMILAALISLTSGRYLGLGKFKRIGSDDNMLLLIVCGISFISILFMREDYHKEMVTLACAIIGILAISTIIIYHENLRSIHGILWANSVTIPMVLLSGNDLQITKNGVFATMVLIAILWLVYFIGFLMGLHKRIKP